MPESLGKTLKKIRESKALSLEDVAGKSHIAKKNLFAIEEDRLSEIGSLFYARGFVKSYARFLGVMENEIVKRYLSDAPKKDDPALVLEGERVPGDWFLKYKKHIGYGIIAVISVSLLFFGFIQMKKFVGNLSGKYRSYAKTRKEEKIARRSFSQVKESKKPKPVVSKEPVKLEGVELEITARSSTWIQVVSDGKLFFRGVLKKGTQDIWRAKKDIKLEIGNAGGVILSLNGKSLGFPGKKGKKKSIVVTKDGIKK